LLVVWIFFALPSLEEANPPSPFFLNQCGFSIRCVAFLPFENPSQPNVLSVISRSKPLKVIFWFTFFYLPRRRFGSPSSISPPSGSSPPHFIFVTYRNTPPPWLSITVGRRHATVPRCFLFPFFPILFDLVRCTPFSFGLPLRLISLPVPSLCFVGDVSECFYFYLVSPVSVFFFCPFLPPNFPGSLISVSERDSFQLEFDL